MKNLKTSVVSFATAKLKAISAITLIAVIGFSFAALSLTGCIIEASDEDDGGTTNTSINGVWKSENGNIITINGSTGVYTQIVAPYALSALNKGLISNGGQCFKALTKTSALQWTGQSLWIWTNDSAPDVALYVTWADCTITMNANGRTFQATSYDANHTLTYTFTRQ